MNRPNRASPVAQVSKPAVSPASQPADRWKAGRRWDTPQPKQVWKPAKQQAWQPALPIAATAALPGTAAGSWSQGASNFGGRDFP